MRIISGSLKGRQFNPKVQKLTRPCTDQAKQSLFNFLISLSDSNRNKFDLNNCVYGCDLFAGTGNIGYEMISRGIQHVTFVDHYKDCVSFIKEQCKIFEVSENATVIKSDVFNFIKNYNDYPLDLIFAGPPYGMDKIKYNQIPEFIFQYGVLNIDYGVLILEHDQTLTFNQNPHFILHKSFRSTHFSFFGNNHLTV
eukprot:438194_1